MKLLHMANIDLNIAPLANSFGLLWFRFRI